MNTARIPGLLMDLRNLGLLIVELLKAKHHPILESATVLPSTVKPVNPPSMLSKKIGAIRALFYKNPYICIPN